MERLSSALLSSAALVLLAAQVAAARVPVPLTPEEARVKRDLLALVRREDLAVTHGRTDDLNGLFLAGDPEAEAARRHALARSAHLLAWAKARHVRFTNVEVGLRTPGIRFLGGERVRVFALVSEAFTYRTLGKPQHEATFGLGIRHWYILQYRAGVAYIAADAFTDPLDQDTRIPGAARPAPGALTAGGSIGQVPDTGARAAVTYAETYCGSAPGCGNGGHYNWHYNDFNGEGGDCTNFVSQVLKAGGFRETPVWSYDHRRGEGTRAWANANALADFLLGSGRATLLARGTYTRLTEPRPKEPAGAVGSLRPGDLIAYEERGRLVHFAVVVGRDPVGYPLVVSHTADRYRVPWDIGWDRRTVFHLLRVHYPTPRKA